MYSYEFYFETNGYGTIPFAIDNLKLERIAVPNPFDPTLPSLKETYGKLGFEKFGTAVSYDTLLNSNNMGFINHHYNSITFYGFNKSDK